MSDLAILQLQPRNNVIHQLVNIIQTVNSWDAFSTFKLPKISRSFDKSLSPGIGVAPIQKLYLKNSTVENLFDGGYVLLRFKLPKIS